MEDESAKRRLCMTMAATKGPLHRIRRRASDTIGVVRYGLLILRLAGLRVTLQKLGHQLYGRTTFLFVTKSLDAPLPPASFRCTLVRASAEDVREFFRGVGRESRPSRYQVLVRRWYHERGFGDCYVAKAAHSNEICATIWMVTPKHIAELGWEERFPLNEDEVMFENGYVPERFRRQGVETAAIVQAVQIALDLGSKHRVAFVAEDNIPQIKSSHKQGERLRSRVLERHFLFRVTRRTIEEYDSPVPIPVPDGP